MVSSDGVGGLSYRRIMAPPHDPPHRPPASLTAPAVVLLLAAGVPTALLLLDAGRSLQVDAAAEALRHQMDPTSSATSFGQRWGAAVSGIAAAPALVAATVALLVLTALVLAAPALRHRAVPTPVRVAGGVVAVVLAVVGALTAVVTVTDLWTDPFPGYSDGGFSLSAAVQQAPVLGPLVFTTLVAATAATVLARPARS